MSFSVSAIIPAYNSATHLGLCLRRLAASSLPPAECIVVDDGSTDDTPAVARQHGASLVSAGGRQGPAFARNLGARQARGDLLVFLDADVCVREDTLRRIVDRFQADPSPDAVIGSYDDTPAAPGFFSQYKNLQHHYVHQTANSSATTFWTGCGAIRRAVFLELGGFHSGYDRPAIEDIEFGSRLLAAGKNILLDRSLQVKHLKRWTFLDILKTDILRRALPWTELILRSGKMPNDLNVRLDQRVSVALMFGAVPLLLASAVILGNAALLFAALCAAAVVLLINAPFYRFLASKRGFWFGAGSALMHLLYFFYSGATFVLALARHYLRWPPSRQ